MPSALGPVWAETGFTPGRRLSPIRWEARPAVDRLTRRSIRARRTERGFFLRSATDRFIPAFLENKVISVSDFFVIKIFHPCHPRIPRAYFGVTSESQETRKDETPCWARDHRTFGLLGSTAPTYVNDCEY